MNHRTANDRIERPIAIHVLPDDLDAAGVATLIQRWHDAEPIISALPKAYVAGFRAELDALLARLEGSDS